MPSASPALTSSSRRSTERDTVRSHERCRIAETERGEVAQETVQAGIRFLQRHSDVDVQPRREPVRIGLEQLLRACIERRAECIDAIRTDIEARGLAVAAEALEQMPAVVNGAVQVEAGNRAAAAATTPGCGIECNENGGTMQQLGHARGDESRPRISSYPQAESDPFPPAVEHELYDGREHDQRRRHAHCPVRLAERRAEVLAVEADDERGDQDDRRDHRELPDDVVLAEAIPLTATGKIDKKRLREQYRDHLMKANAG